MPTPVKGEGCGTQEDMQAMVGQKPHSHRSDRHPSHLRSDRHPPHRTTDLQLNSTVFKKRGEATAQRGLLGSTLQIVRSTLAIPSQYPCRECPRSPDDAWCGGWSWSWHPRGAPGRPQHMVKLVGNRPLRAGRQV
jgi:hypothetical protein